MALAAPPRGDARHAASFGDMLRFDGVPVQRYTSRTSPGVLWPDFEAQYHARHLQAGTPICERPQLPPEPLAEVSEPCAFIGIHEHHFGHFVAESAPRLPLTLRDAPELPLVFTTLMPIEAATMAPALRAVLDWYGIAPGRLRFVHRPTRFRDLRIAPQAEHLDGPAPLPAYLDALEAHAARRGVTARPEGIVYVSRAGLPAQQGGHAGEAYLEDCLRRLGVRVIRPETLPLPEQLAAYAGARHLVLAEGSAAHGRQLLGRIDQDLSILVRRPGGEMARDPLAVRARSLTYVPGAAQDLHFLDADGARWDPASLAFYDLPALMDHFAALGVPLARIWDAGAYAQARDARILAWFAALHAPRTLAWLRPQNPPGYFFGQLSQLGLAHLHAPVAAILDTQEGRG